VGGTGPKRPAVPRMHEAITTARRAWQEFGRFFADAASFRAPLRRAGAMAEREDVRREGHVFASVSGARIMALPRSRGAPGVSAPWRPSIHPLPEVVQPFNRTVDPETVARAPYFSHHAGGAAGAPDRRPRHPALPNARNADLTPAPTGGRG